MPMVNFIQAGVKQATTFAVFFDMSTAEFITLQQQYIKPHILSSYYQLCCLNDTSLQFWKISKQTHENIDPFS